MKILDFAGQTIIIIWLVVTLFLGWRNSDYQFFMVAMFYMGVWQLSSSVFWLVRRHELYKRRLLHLGFSVAYFVFVYVSAELGAKNITAFCGLAWLIAGFSFATTVKTAFGNQSNGTFLRHLSF